MPTRTRTRDCAWAQRHRCASQVHARTAAVQGRVPGDLRWGTRAPGEVPGTPNRKPICSGVHDVHPHPAGHNVWGVR